jgi:hypothetical protein
VVDAPDAKLNSEYSVNPSNYHSSELESSIRRYRARFCKATPPQPSSKLTHYPMIRSV